MRIKSGKLTNSKYPESLKIFANSIRFHSKPAYAALRKLCGNALPCESSFENWGSPVDYKPGILEDIIDYFGDIVEVNAEAGKKLFFNLTYDEMNINSGVKWNPKRHCWTGYTDLGVQLPNHNRKNAPKYKNNAAKDKNEPSQCTKCNFLTAKCKCH